MDAYQQPNYNYNKDYPTHQQFKDPFSSMADNRFSPSTTITLASELLTELIAFHKKKSRKQLIYFTIFFGLFAVVGLIIFGTSFAIPKCSQSYEQCSRTDIVLLVMGLTLVGTTLIVLPITFCVWSCQMQKQWSDFDHPTGQEYFTVWRFDGEEWLRFLNYIHGPDRQWRDLAPLSSFCCRRESYERLSNRPYGHIILYNNGFILDELYVISFRIYSLLGVELLSFGNNPSTLGLRIQTYLQAGKNSRHIYFDLFAPSSVTQEQLQVIAQSYNRSIGRS